LKLHFACGSKNSSSQENKLGKYRKFLGKHLSNIYSYAKTMISHSFGAAKLDDQIWYLTQGWRLDGSTSSTIFLAYTLWDSRLHDCIHLTSSRGRFEEHLDRLLAHGIEHYLKTRQRDKNHCGMHLEFFEGKQFEEGGLEISPIWDI